jgi:osmotically inducible protein OsmC
VSVAGIERSAEIVWAGGLADGGGTVRGGSGALDVAVTWASRVESPEGRTSPEELVAAAHAACYAMALSHTLGEAGSPPAELRVTARVEADLGDDGLRILRSELDVEGRVSGLDASEFQRLAEKAEQGCPVSNALRGGIEIGVRATLDD